MGFTGKSRVQNMGFLFVFLPEEKQGSCAPGEPSSSSSSSSSASSNSSSSIISRKRNGASSGHLLSRAQSTISICALLVLVTFLLFALSSFEPSSNLYNPSSSSSSYFLSRRQLRGQYSSNRGKDTGEKHEEQKVLMAPDHALQGMGSLYRRGTKSMSDLIVAHVSESLNVHELRLFLRLFFSSSLNSRADLLFLFPAKSPSFDNVIMEESNSFQELATGERNTSRASDSKSPEAPAQEMDQGKKGKRGSKEPIWGVKAARNSVDGNRTRESNVSNYGSVIGFDVDELDPENSLAGFLDHLPMSFRRWTCYPMLFGRVKRDFKHIMLIDPKELLLLGDPMAGLRTSSLETVYLSAASITPRHAKRNTDKTPANNPKTPAIVKGGARGIRRLSQAMLNEIVRAAGQKKKKGSITETGIFNQLVENDNLLKNVKLIPPFTDLIPELGSLPGHSHKPTGTSSGTQSSAPTVSVVRRGNSNFDVNSPVSKHILCSLHYRNCS